MAIGSVIQRFIILGLFLNILTIIVKQNHIGYKPPKTPLSVKSSRALIPALVKIFVLY